MKKLTKEQLEELGFVVEVEELKTKTKYYCYYPENDSHDAYVSYTESELIGEYYELPTFIDIIRKVSYKSAKRTEQHLSEKIVQNLFL